MVSDISVTKQPMPMVAENCF